MGVLHVVYMILGRCALWVSYNLNRIINFRSRGRCLMILSFKTNVFFPETKLNTVSPQGSIFGEIDNYLSY